MSFEPMVGFRYDMPVVFGHSQVPEKTSVEKASVLALSFHTEKLAVEELVPACFHVPESPLVTWSHVSYHDVDYLGGRSYNEMVCTVSAVAREPQGELQAAYALVLWVNQVGALMAGREYMGLPKLYGNISDLQRETDATTFTFSEYEALLGRGWAKQLEPFSISGLEKLNQRAGAVRTFGWKYIPSAEGGSDLAYPLENVMRWRYTRAWTGIGGLDLFSVTHKEAPFSCAAIAALAALPVSGEVRAFLGEGAATIDRTATRRIQVV